MPPLPSNGTPCPDLGFECGCTFEGNLKRSPFGEAKPEPGGRIGSSSLSSPPLLLSAGQDSKGRLGDTEIVWCGSGTFCWARGRAHGLLVSIGSKQELKLVGLFFPFCHGPDRLRSAAVLGEGGRPRRLLGLFCEFSPSAPGRIQTCWYAKWKSSLHFSSPSGRSIFSSYKFKVLQAQFFPFLVESIPPGACPPRPSVF